MSDATATVREAAPCGMITLRGDLGSQALRDACTGLTGTGFPGQREVTWAEAGGIAWMSPDEVLLVLKPAAVAPALAALRDALAGTHHLAVDVSDARASLDLTGLAAREVLAKLAPVDLHPDAFGPGQVRRSRLGQVAAAFWMVNDTDFRVICFRSVADYALDLLRTSAEAGPVGHFPP